MTNYFSNDTIFAPLTPVGGTINLVRVSGSNVLEVLNTLAPHGAPQLETRPSHAIVSSLHNKEGQIFDEALMIYFKGPKSFTGEDVLEIHAHGGVFTLQELIERLVDLGVRPAGPGEFSFRAVKNSKMTLSQAEAVSDLIASKNRTAGDLAIEKYSGLVNHQVGEIAEKIRTLVSLSELGIDFSDEDVEEVSLKKLKLDAALLQAKIRTLADSFERGKKIQEGISTVFIGLPNAGKSSLFNALLGEERSIVTEFAGTTRDVVRETLNLKTSQGSITLKVSDTAGLRFAADPAEKIGVDRTTRAALEADLLLWVVNGAAPELQNLEKWIKTAGIKSSRTIGVITHADLSADSEWKGLEEALTKLTCVSEWHRISSLTGEGISELILAISRSCMQWTRRDPGELILTRVEHERAARRSVDALERAMTASTEDLFASDLKQALFELSPVIGITVSDDILGRIFSQFCIGK